jgi:hypothetical protein
VSIVAWDSEDWESWSNDLADALPDRYDGDAAQEAIILDAVQDMAAKLAAIRDYIDNQSRDFTSGTSMLIRHRIRSILGGDQ